MVMQAVIQGMFGHPARALHGARVATLQPPVAFSRAVALSCPALA